MTSAYLTYFQFKVHEASFFGFTWTSDKNKIKAIRNMPPPKNVAEFQSFMGMINYLNRTSSSHHSPDFKTCKAAHEKRGAVHVACRAPKPLEVPVVAYYHPEKET